MPTPSASSATRRVSLRRSSQSNAEQVRPAGDAAMLWDTFAPALAADGRYFRAEKRQTKWDYLPKNERSLPDPLPSVPAAVRVCGGDGRVRILAIDLDAKGQHTPEDATRDHAYLESLLGMLGMRWISDIGPGGGRHLYLPLAEPIPFHEARAIVEGLKLRLPTVDPGPHRSARTGCIRVPGSAHPNGDYQRLTMPLPVALAAIERPVTPDELNEFVSYFETYITTAATNRTRAGEAHPVMDGPAHADDELAGLSARITRIARHGDYDTARYPSPSEARYAVVVACAAAGWNVTDIDRRMRSHVWPGLASFYARYGSPTERLKALRRDYDSAVVYLSASETPGKFGDTAVRRSHTSAPQGVGDHTSIRTWRAAVRYAERGHLHGREWYSLRFLLRSLGEAAHKSRSLHIAHGCRAHALSSGMSPRTVSEQLRTAERLGFVSKTARAVGIFADEWLLTVPDGLADAAREARLPHGKQHSLRPAFRALGRVCALVFEAVEDREAQTVNDLYRHLSMSRSNVYEAVEMLLSWSLLERGTDRLLTAHPERLNHVAEYLGIDEEIQAQVRRYRKERREWAARLAKYHRRPPLVALQATSDGHAVVVGALEIEAA